MEWDEQDTPDIPNSQTAWRDPLLAPALGIWGFDPEQGGSRSLPVAVERWRRVLGKAVQESLDAEMWRKAWIWLSSLCLEGRKSPNRAGYEQDTKNSHFAAI